MDIEIAEAHSGFKPLFSLDDLHQARAPLYTPNLGHADPGPGEVSKTIQKI